MKKSILNLFRFNIETLPDNSFTEVGYQVNSKGIFLKKYSKDFDDKTYKIFDKIEIINFGAGKNVGFISMYSKEINIYGFKELINDLNKIYGPDSVNRGCFCFEDFKKIKNKSLNLYEIRTWEGVEDKLEPVTIWANWYLNSISFIIYNVGLF